MSLLTALLVALSQLVPAAHSRPRPIAKPKLILVIAIDQFRADYLTRFESRFLPASARGFRYLMEKGAYYSHAEHDQLQCMTGPGHAAILTGSRPYLNGIPINYWYSDAAKDKFYCTQDDSSALVGAEQKKKQVGTTPRNLLSTTLGDELKSAGYASRMVSVSVKDRAAILMAGYRADAAIWFNGQKWVSSGFYAPAGKLPPWVDKLNSGILLGSKTRWEASGRPTGLTSDLKLPMADYFVYPLMGARFPHEAEVGGKGTTTMPWAIDETLRAAKAAMDAVELGKDAIPDILAVSFSTHDYVGHSFGPNSREAEEITVHEDHAVANLVSAAASAAGGLDKIWIALTADHGGTGIPEQLAEWRLPSGRISEAELKKKIDARLDEKFGKADWVPFVADLNVFLDESAIAEKGLDHAAVEAEAKAAVAGTPGAFLVIGEADWRAGRLPGGILGRQIRSTYFPGRSGDLIVIPGPGVGLADEDPATHISGWTHDRMVPLILVGPPFRAGLRAEKAEVIDLAPTLAFALGIVPPSLSEGRVLAEAFPAR